MQAAPEKGSIVASVKLAKVASPAEVQLKFCVPGEFSLASATGKGRPAGFSGIHQDTVVVKTGNARSIEIVADYIERGGGSATGWGELFLLFTLT